MCYEFELYWILIRFLCVRSYGALREEDKMWGWDIRGGTFADAPSLSDDISFPLTTGWDADLWWLKAGTYRRT